MADYQSKFTGEEIDELLQKVKDGVQSDYEQYDSTQPDFIKNKPFGDNLPVTEYFSQVETPDPVSFEFAAVNMIFYKIFDFVLSAEQGAQGFTVTTNGITESVFEATVDNFGGIAYLFTFPSGAQYAAFNQSGELTFDETMGITINVPEIGIYFVSSIGTPLPEGFNVELNYIGTKKIDPKYLPKLSLPEQNLPEQDEVIILGGTASNPDFFPLSDEQITKMESLLFNPYVNVRVYIGEALNASLLIYVPLTHIGFGIFELKVYLPPLINQKTIVVLDAAQKGLRVAARQPYLQEEVTEPTESTTYSLRKPSFADVIKTSLEERGLLNKEVTQ